MLSQMFGKLFMNSPLLTLPLFSLGVFMGVFLLVAASVLSKKAAAFDEVAKLPIDDNEVSRERRD